MQKAVTIRTLARELGLSVSAVSKALNDYPDIGTETKALVHAKAQELGYTPNVLARNLAKKTSSFVGIVLRDSSSVYGECFKQLSEVAFRHDLNLILYDTSFSRTLERQCVKNLIDTMAMGVIVVPVSEDAAQIVKMTRDRLPVVFLGGRVRDNSCNYVCADSGRGAELALRHLIGLGHRRIALALDGKKSDSRSRKLDVYRRLMQELGEQPRVYYCGRKDTGLAEAGYQLGQRILAGGDGVTAIFAVKDQMAFGIIQAIRDAGLRVPEDISVVGYDGMNAAALPMIRLTTVACPRQPMSEMILRILLNHAENLQLPPEHEILEPELIVRGTTCEINRGACL